MVIEQTVEIPVSHRLVFDLPVQIPTGRAKAALTLTFESEDTLKTSVKNNTGKSITEQLNEVYSGPATMVDDDIRQAQYDLLNGEDW